MIKAVVAGLLGLLAFFCRTKTDDRRDPRLLGEFALVVLTMLFVSERSWKHHYVTVLLPITYLVSEFFSPRVGPRGRAAIVLSWALSFSLMASTSPEIGGLFIEGQGHEIAQGYGLFMWAGVVLYATVAWRVWVRRKEAPTRRGRRTSLPPRSSPVAWPRDGGRPACRAGTRRESGLAGGLMRPEPVASGRRFSTSLARRVGVPATRMVADASPDHAAATVRPNPHFPIRTQAKEGRMKTSKELPRAHRRRYLSPELLEDRMVLSSGQGSTFAIMPAAVTTAGKASSVPFT